MQAYGLHEADGHHAQVVKVVVESRSNCAGLLLADSTCLLISLSSSNTCRPVSIPAPSTDACFVRLQTCSAPILSSRALSIHKAASGVTSACGGELGEEYSKLMEGRGTPGDYFSGSIVKISPDGYRGKSGRLLSTGTGKRVLGNRTSRVFFLTAQPGKGGSCIDLRAWLCEPPSFTRARVELGSGKGLSGPVRSTSQNHLRHSRTGRGAYARLDVPHGMSIKMVASVNVLIVYCISVGKIWVMAAKHVTGGELPSDSDSTCKSAPGYNFCLGRELEREVSETSEGGKNSDISGYLLLIKCAVLDVRSPINALHVSLQHLLLGEVGGLWVWPLRPLIKPDKRQKDKERGKEMISSLCEQNGDASHGKAAISAPSRHGGNRQRDEGTSVIGDFSEDDGSDTLRKDSDEDQQMIPTRMTEPREQKILPRTVFETRPDEESKDREKRVGGSTIPVGENGTHLKNYTAGVVLTSDLQGDGYFSHTNGGRECNLGENTCGTWKWGHPGNMHESQMPPVLKGSKEGVPRTALRAIDCASAGLIEGLDPSTFDFEEQVHAGLLGGNATENFIWKVGVLRKRRDAVLLNHSGVESLDYDQESDRVFCMDACVFSEKSHTLDAKSLDHVKQVDGQGLLRPLYVPICKANQQDVLMVGKEGDFQVKVVDIQEISLRRFVILDSHGEMHLLTLNDLQEQGTSSFIQCRHPSLTPFPSSMKVTLMAVIPASSAPLEPMSVVRKVWISDGHHSHHIINMLGVGAHECMTDLKTTNSSPMHVLSKISRIVFTEDKVVALAAVSSGSVLVVTQGSIMVYVLSVT